MREANAVIVGGGFYGCCIALLMREHFNRVLLLEREEDILMRASSLNQARIHTGYHYPRSLLTAYRSFINFPRFALDFRKAVRGDFVKLYAIARMGSKVNAARFHQMFKQMGARIALAQPRHGRLFNKDYIEETFQVEELAFDASELRRILRERLDKAGVEVACSAHVERVEATKGDGVLLHLADAEAVETRMAFNCTYSRLNHILNASSLPLLPLKYEFTEMALIELPEALREVAVTVMDGPFFSVMPYPTLGLHTLSHVTYTPHLSWSDAEGFRDHDEVLAQYRVESHYLHMVRDSARYLPALADAKYRDSIYEVKTVLLQNESDDGRPIMFKPHYGIRNLSVVLGGKLDNIYDILDVIHESRKSLGLGKGLS